MAGRVVALVAAAGVLINACGATPPNPPTGPIGSPRSTIPTPTHVLANPPSTPTLGPPTSSPVRTPAPALVLSKTRYGVTAGQGVNAINTAVGFGSLWVPIYARPHGWLIRIDTATNKVTARIPVGESPDSVTILGGSVWIGNTQGDASRPYKGQNTLDRIDPRTNRIVQTVRVEVGGPIVGGFGAIWAMSLESGDGNGTLRKVDATTGRIVGTFPLAGLPRIACGSLWTVDTVPGANVPAVTIVSRIDPRTGRRLDRWPVIAGGATIPTDALGRCFAIWSPDGAPQSSVVASIDPSVGIVHLSPEIHALVRVIGGSFWGVDPPSGVVQPLTEDGASAGPASALPVTSLDEGDWVFLHVGDGYWVVSQSGVFQIRLAG